MGNYKCRRPGFLSARQLLCVEAVFQGRSNEDIIANIFGGKKDDPASWKRARDAFNKTKASPRFIEYYNSMVTEFRVHNYGKAMNKIAQLVEDPNPWVALQAANRMVNHTERAVVSPEENAVTVKIEGMPALGEPTAEETDALPEAQPIPVEAEVV